MKYRALCRSGCAVSTHAIGTMTFGAETADAGSPAQLVLEAGATPVGATRLDGNLERGVPADDRSSAQRRTWAMVDAVRQVAGEWGSGTAKVALARPGRG